MRVAVVTSLSSGRTEHLPRCLGSVAAQTAPVFLHLLVGPGAEAASKASGLPHVKGVERLAPGDPWGNQARAEGALQALSAGADVVCFLDPPHHLDPDHVAAVLAEFQRPEGADSPLDVVCSYRAIFVPGHEHLRLRDPDDLGRSHVDGSCLAVHRRAARLLALWGQVPASAAAIADRVVFSVARIQGLRLGWTGRASVRWESRFPFHYQCLGLRAPVGDRATLDPAACEMPSAEVLASLWQATEGLRAASGDALEAGGAPTASPEPARPLLKLCMIVKNEHGDIVPTLTSIREHVDAWCIVDTGSTDGTQAQVRALMAAVPGELHEIPFVDFSTTRNAGLDLAGTDCEFLLCLDAEDVVQEPEKLRAFLETQRHWGQDGYYVRLHNQGTAYDSVLVTRSAARWRYRGVVHEVMISPDGRLPERVVPETTITKHRSQASLERSRARWERDLALLSLEAERNPTDTRTAFYLAQTYMCLGRNAEAVAAYRHRVELGGWVEEVFYSLLTIARLSKSLGASWPDVQQLYLEAHAIAPHRAEPLCAVAEHYVEEKAWPLAFIYAQRAWELPYPAQDRLFVDEDAYTWRAADLLGTCAYHVGEFAIGEQAARAALAARPDEPRLADNLKWYERLRAGTSLQT